MKRFLAFLILITEFPLIGIAQNITTMDGLWTSYTPSNPFGDTYTSARKQFIYTNSMLGNVGLPSGVYITKLSFPVYTTNIDGHLLENYTIKLANSTNNSFTTLYFINSGNTVYGPSDFQFPSNFTGDIEFNLNTPFYYSGNNLTLTICYGSYDATTSDAPIYKTTQTFDNNGLYVEENNIIGCNVTSYNSQVSSTQHLPVVNFTYYTPCTYGLGLGATISSADSICPGTSITLHTEHLLYGDSDYKWFSSPVNPIGYTEIIGATDSVETFNPTTDTYYRCRATCPNLTLNSNPILIHVNDLEGIQISPNEQLGCDQDSLDLIEVFVNSPDSSFLSYQWYYETDPTAFPIILQNATQPYYTPPNNILYNRYYFVRILDSLNGCFTNSPAVHVQKIGPTVSFQTQNFNVCLGDTISFNASGASSYEWSNNINNGTPFPAFETGYFSVIAYDSIGCSIEINDAIQVGINLPPTVVAMPDTTICTGAEILFRAIGALNYEWNNGVLNNEYAIPTSTQYIVIGSDSNGCIGSDTVNFFFNEILNPQVSPSINGTSYGNDGSIEIDYSATNPPCTFDWSFDGTGDFNDEQNLLNVPAGDYSLTIVDSLGCTSHYNYNVPLNLNMFIPTAISPNNDGFNDTWQIRGLEQFEWYEISVFNSQGVLVFHKVNGYSPWNGYYNSEHLVADDYIYVIDTKNPGRRFTGYITITY